ITIWTEEENENPLWQNQGSNASVIQPGDAILLYAQGKDDTGLDWAWLWTNETGGAGKNYTGSDDGDDLEMQENATNWTNSTGWDSGTGDPNYNPSQAFDDDWNTYARTLSSTSGTLWMNYTIPGYAHNNSKWETKTGGMCGLPADTENLGYCFNSSSQWQEIFNYTDPSATNNDTIPSSCMAGSVLQLKIESSPDFACQCHIYEERVWWNLSGVDYIYAQDMGDVVDTWTWSNFTWKNSSLSLGTTVTWKIYYNDTSGNWNVSENYSFTINYIPVIYLESPMDDSGDNDGNVIFKYNVSDDSDIANCSLILNGNINQTNSSITKEQSMNFTLSNLPVASYNWSINCTDTDGNEGNSNTRYVDVILTTDFGGETTDLSQVNVSDIENFTVENVDNGKIRFIENVNLSGGVDLNSVINISDNFISVNTTAEPRLNKSAKLFFYNLSYEEIPVVMRDNEICSDCIIESYQSWNLTFNVTHFTNFTTGENSNLTIWDDTDPEGGSQIKYSGDQVNFYANYTNKTSGESINGTGVYCNITFEDTGTHDMGFNDTLLLYDYNRSFSSNGTFDWNVSCNGSSLDYETLNTTDNVTISNSYIEVNLSIPPDNTVVPWIRNFTVNATVICRDGNCGEVKGTTRYNASGSNPDTNISTIPGATPFYTFDSNPKSCGTLDKNENCTLIWSVNSTGSLGDYYKIGVLFNGVGVNNHTENNTIEIGKVLVMSLTFDTVNFGLLSPGDTEKPAENNSDEYYNISIDPNSND
ncbi:MAG: hypothetical protein KAT37_04500, partial [Candidatus Aenigmarchaeota archaeon]|nr:hypothetical protein [Candidatus Aenigmarchaeota archaeon]